MNLFIFLFISIAAPSFISAQTPLSPYCVPNTEIFQSCGCDGSCDVPDQTCAGCSVGCFCAPGHVRDDNGVCVPLAECPNNTCGINEVEVACPDFCTFENDCLTSFGGVVRSCPTMSPSYNCTPRCDCAPGFYRIDGQCQTADQCPSSTCMNDNEEFNACGSCDGSCTNPNPTCQRTCVPGCFCLGGYVRDENGTCIPLANCPLEDVSCGENEVAVICPPICILENKCLSLFNEIISDCTTPATDYKCIPGCECKPNFVRVNGKCVEETKSNLTCGTNEVLNVCPGYCTFENDCPTLLGVLVRDCAPPPINYHCEPRCDCRPEYVRINGSCVSPSQCPNSTCIRANEVVDVCGCDLSCANSNQTCSPDCRIGCYCQMGYVRDEFGTCIPVENCPVVNITCGLNEVANMCPAYCTFENDCVTSFGGVEVSCQNTSDAYICAPRCDCAPGFYRIDGLCQTADNCPPETCIREYEVFNSCGTCDGTCTDPNPNCTEVCVPGCYCAPGTLRNDSLCIPQSSCPNINITCDANEIINLCPAYCTFENDCLRLFGLVNSSCGAQPSDYQCTPRCDCATDYVRINGSCVLVDQCPGDICPGENEVPDICGCNHTCTNFNQTCFEGCRPGCYCEAGYVNDVNGVCIPVQSCSNVNLTCAANEVVNICPAYCSLENDCSTSFGGISLNCTQPLNYTCIPSCVCAPGYYRINGSCLTADNCPNNTCIRQNEVFNACGTCDATCANPNPTCNQSCVPGCFCAPGYVRNVNGMCVATENCNVNNVTCGTNEVANLCPGFCEFENDCYTAFGGVYISCSSASTEYNCTPRCDCAPGFYRINGLCQTADNCPNNTCRLENEVFNPCGSCDSTCINPNPICLPSCIPGCYCAPGYVRNMFGLCVSNTSCPSVNLTCSANEVLNMCPAYCSLDDGCSTLNGGGSISCTTPPNYICQPSCLCAPGYYRINGVCVTANNCPNNTCSGQNEEFNPCGTCDGTCLNPIPTCPPPCVPGCYCLSGYLRNALGVCIANVECPPVNQTCGANEVLNMCPAYCSLDDGCSALNGGGSISCTTPPNYICQPSCLCAPGYYRINGVCVTANNCPNNTCSGQNEEFNPCGTCDGTCLNPSPTCPPPCVPGCYCLSGYLRNALGVCIANVECPPVNQTCGANEVLNMCPAYCSLDDGCSALNGGGSISCTTPPNYICQPSCLCAPGYYRINGVCVTANNCPNNTCSGQNEEFNPCGTCDGTCLNPSPTCPPPCVPGCYCLSGYLRNALGVCIANVECPPVNQTCGANEVLNMCPAYCSLDDGCSALNGGGSISCTTPPNYICQPSCLCAPGYYRINGVCVTANNCPNNTCSGQNEEFNPCGTCDGTCLNPSPTCPPPCVPGCYCLSGYLRNALGVCIANVECPPVNQTCGANEVLNMCPAYCSLDDGCSALNGGGSISCTTPPNYICQPSCLCAPGYYRINGVCVTANNCPNNTCSGQNEEFNPCGTCDGTCLNPSPTCPPPCVPGCYCLSGYLRNALGVCIANVECPPVNQTCGANEVLNMCPAYCSLDDGCSALNGGGSISCTTPPNYICQPSCLCAPGYYRINGVCVTANNCPNNTCLGQNELFNPCGTCDGTCLNPSPSCPQQCVPGCYCAPGYVRNTFGLCVSNASCPTTVLTCGANEVVNMCPGYCSLENNCPTAFGGVSVNCTEPSNYNCTPSCECAPGYYRIEGLCQTPDQCPPSTCVGANEVFNPCGTCDGTCVNPNPACNESCIPGCFCIGGYVRGSNGGCIPITSCQVGNLTCDDNEVVNLCPDYCSSENDCLISFGGVTLNCSVEPPDYVCTPRCDCAPGFYRINGECQTADQCPNNTCVRPNEVFNANGACDISCGNIYTTCAPTSVAGCYCEPGYVRNENGICIPHANCGVTNITCGTNEVVNMCPAFCTFENDCYTAFGGVSISCPTMSTEYHCTPRCDCTPGYYRINGLCLTADNCPNNTCLRDNEVFNSCGSCDATCSELYPACVGCIPGCYCAPGYVREEGGNCIPSTSCPNVNITCDINEVVNMCPPFCTFESSCLSVFVGVVVDCTTPASNYICTPRCDCAPTYVRINGSCVPPDQCSDDTCLRENEVIDMCGCDRTCADPNRTCTGVCTPGCYCDTGYVRHESGICIPVANCPGINITCGANEVANLCPAYCTFDNDCSVTFGGVEVTCPSVPDNYTCVPRCDCASGYFRINGVCQLPTQCPNNTCVRANEVFNGCGTCDGSCADPNPMCPEECVPGCYCEPGFVRNETGECVLQSTCQNGNLTCGANEVLNSCPSYCSNENNCFTLFGITTRNCTGSPTDYICTPRCDCAAEFVRINGICVSADQCDNDICPDENEIPELCGCDQTCANPNQTCSDACTPACYCEVGYVRNPNGDCVLLENCPPITCGANEVINMCPAFCSYDSTCLTAFSGVVMSCPTMPPTNSCVPRCDCAPGFYRINGLCQTAYQCPNNTCLRENELFNPCGTCDGTCTNPNPACNVSCVPGCFCSPGFVRNDNGICISVMQCAGINLTCGANEVVNSCPAYCSYENDCFTSFGGVVVNCSTQPPDYTCVPRCECAPGFYRINGLCQTVDQCPNNTCLRANEVFNSCGNCDGTCAEPTPACMASTACIPGCFCEPGYVRGENGTCIAIIDCPITNITCGEYEVANMCPAFCTFENTCESLFNGIVTNCTPPATAFRCIPRCDCTPDSVRINGTCVSPLECPYFTTCLNDHEVFKKNGRCDGTCDDPRPTCSAGPPGCRCIKGFVRNNNGTCISRNKCRPNERYRKCGTCDPTCERPKLKCRVPCRQGYFCKRGYVRNALGRCVKLRSCFRPIN